MLGNVQFSYMQAESRELLQNQLTALCAGQQQDAAEFSDAYLEPLVEELVARLTFIDTRKSNPAANLKAEELGYSREGETTQYANSYPL
jgi:hypothetical protein